VEQIIHIIHIRFLSHTVIDLSLVSHRKHRNHRKESVSKLGSALCAEILQIYPKSFKNLLSNICIS